MRSPSRSVRRVVYLGLSLCSVVAVSLVARPHPALAQSSDAEILLRRAAELRSSGRYEDALRLADRARELDSGAAVLGEIALCEVALERWIDAERDLAALLARDDPWVRRQRLTLEATLGDVRGRLARVELSRGPPGATVEINGVAAGAFPLREAVRVVAGTVRIVVRARGYRDYRREVTVFAGGTHFEEVLMEPLRAATREPTAVARCGPGLVLRQGLCYAREDPSRAGSVRPGAVALWGGVALTAAAGITAIALGADGDRVASDYTDRCGQVFRADCAAQYAEARETLDDRAAAVNAMIALSVVGAISAVVGAVLEVNARRRPIPRATLQVGPLGARLRW